MSFRHPMILPKKSRKPVIVKTRDLDATAVEIPDLGVRRHLANSHAVRGPDIALGRSRNAFGHGSRGGLGWAGVC